MAAQTIPCAPWDQLLRIVIDQLGKTRQATGAPIRRGGCFSPCSSVSRSVVNVVIGLRAVAIGLTQGTIFT